MQLMLGRAYDFVVLTSLQVGDGSRPWSMDHSISSTGQALTLQCISPSKPPDGLGRVGIWEHTFSFPDTCQVSHSHQVHGIHKFLGLFSFLLQCFLAMGYRPRKRSHLCLLNCKMEMIIVPSSQSYCKN